MRLRLLSVLNYQDDCRLTGCSSDPVDILHDVLSTWLEVGKERYSVRDRLEIVDGEGDVDGVGHGDEVKDGVGRSTESHGQDLRSASDMQLDSPWRSRMPLGS